MRPSPSRRVHESEEHGAPPGLRASNVKANEQTQLSALELALTWKNNQVPWSGKNRELAPYVSVEMKGIALVNAQKALERPKTLSNVGIEIVR